MSEGGERRGRARDPRVKIGDVARAAGVHPSTVSRVLRNDRKGRISPDVARRVSEVARELGYRPNAIAASMRTKSTRTVGFVVHDMSDPVYPPLLKGLERALMPEGFMVVVGNTGYDLQAEFDLLERLAARLVDGLVLATTRLEDPVLEHAEALGLPVVSVLRRDAAERHSAVVNDCEGGMRALVAEVLARGHRDIAYISAPPEFSTARERHRGVTVALDAARLSLAPDRQVVLPRMDVEEGRRAARRLLEARGQPPECIVCVNDLVALGALRACHEAGLDCPRDISITGYNDIPFLDMMAPPLASVRMDLEEIGRRAGKLFLSRMQDPDAPARIERVGTELRLRASLGAPRGGAG